jgi:hypothetical protein
MRAQETRSFGTSPCNRPSLRYRVDSSPKIAECERAPTPSPPKSLGISGLPALVDLLPVMVASVGIVRSPRSLLDVMRLPAAAMAG